MGYAHGPGRWFIAGQCGALERPWRCGAFAGTLEDFRAGTCGGALDVVLEKTMHKCILKLLKSHIEAMLREFHTADGSWKQLKENLQLVQQWNPQELGVFVPTPDFVDVEKMKVKFVTMQKMYSPEKKVMLLLRVCKLIYTVMENNSGFSAGFQTQELVLVAGSFQKGDIVHACIKKMPIIS
ncbi:ras and Rab interactor 2-like isoform X2 [Falco rusticolus]|uniref:ras and Rab interactor 2-like isoform X2 n=1 Tax=Falco rusticolus TaxID=120794 RepID=UPI001886A0AA|nr:ras and Rab interactor 2-like isoform X2 [Falco rusticolus]